MMNSPPVNTTLKHRLRFRRGGALYVMVLSTTLIVSLLGLAGVAIVRIERRQADGVDAMLRARQNARSAVEQALRVVADTPDWRTTYPHGVESTPKSLGPNGRGTVSWMITDSDGNLSDIDGNLTLHGIGRVGDAVQVSSLGVQAAAAGPYLLRYYDNPFNYLNLRTERVEDDEYYGQYLLPSIPWNAIGWRVTGIQFYGKREYSDRILKARIYLPTGANMPSSTVVDSVDVNSSSFSTNFGWKTITFNGQTMLDPDVGICFSLETTESLPPIEFQYYDGGVFETISALLAGDPGWDTYSTSKALRYRLYGVYVTPDGELQPISGSWQRQVSPDPPIDTSTAN